MAIKKPKRPKKPKASASLESWKKFEERLKDWNKRCNEIDSDKKKKEAMIKKYR